ncbi:MAG TPA: SDR family NAD(P)-dependent oxidoreductase [Myxococcales bacterium]|nr:SDR family NAD(P)-dependent oxidoreductase [Myxococcales bacterium]HIK86297.1 SDR family NAD(P)-dependent oxidoreductase [Myxococcales bacterium]
MSGFDKDTTTDEVLDGLDLSGRRIVITGTSSGLGLETARAMASKGGAITMLARSVEKNEAAASRVREQVPGVDLETREIDLTSFESVRACAEGILEAHDKIDILINNAGVMVCPYSTNADGFENQLVSNHLGHFLLSVLLTPALIRGAPARVVELSSGAHGMSDFDFDDPNFAHREYNPWVAYGQSKTANALFALEYNRRLSDRGVSAYSVHPGVIMTELGRHMTEETMQQMFDHVRAAAEASGESLPDAPPAIAYKTVEAGAATQCWAATASELDGQGGKYLADCQVAIVGGDTSERGVMPYARDPEAARKLWTLSENWVGQKLEA